MKDFPYISSFKHHQCKASKNKPNSKHNAACELIQAQGIIHLFLKVGFFCKDKMSLSAN